MLFNTLAPNLHHAVRIMIDGSRSAESVNNGISTFIKVILAAAEPFKRHVRPRGRTPVVRPRRSPWWNDQCANRKRDFQRAWDIYIFYETDEYYGIFKAAKRMYRNTCRYHRSQNARQRIHSSSSKFISNHTDIVIHIVIYSIILHTQISLCDLGYTQ